LLSGWFDFVDDGPDVKYVVWVGSAEGGSGDDDSTDAVSLKFASVKVHYVGAVKVETRHSEIFRFPETKG
jgi:hypothetical protein